jgi:hypothetical protein
MKDQNIYLLSTYIGKPKDPKKTHLEGYMSTPENIEYDERILITKGLKDKDRQSSHLVLDLTEEKVIKNTFTTDTEFTALFTHFFENYGDQIDVMVRALQGIKSD